ncbi:PREDICTED: pentatricopeptide repeat-containing protein At3g02650, mitochondrial [Ipomoea nil]|uniref:pentatricopeptide repeat-containing protein At3g02650, mitochondrial n=1 Tax=Ipomoea nil TaxID=35883 RepID=UPI000900EE28|nr:PREDICTED: pentatricopeptide repeat-containing protein At3g02650, mitochondrial [Ipomoea nil]
MLRSTITVGRKALLRRLEARLKHSILQSTSQVCYSIESPLNPTPHFTASRNCVCQYSFRFFSSNPSLDSEESEFSNADASASGHWASAFDEEKSQDGSSSVFGEVDDGFAAGNDFAVENGEVPFVVKEDGEPEVSLGEEEEEEEEGGDSVEKLERMLSLLQSSGMVEGSLESSLEDIGLNVDEEHVIKVLETKYIPGENLIEFFSWASRRPGMAMSTTMVEMLTRAICSGETMRDAYALWKLLNELREKEIVVLSTDILNELISFFSRFAKGKAAYEVFNKFGDFGCEPNSDTYYFTIEAVSRRKIYDWASSVSEKMLGAQKLPDACRVGKIISFLCKGNKARDAHLVYMAAKGNGISLPQTSVNLLIKSLCDKDEDVYSAFEMVQEFSRDERKHAIYSFSSVIQGLCRPKDDGEKKAHRSKDVQEAKNLLLSMVDAGPPPGNAVFNTVITALSKQGDMEEATKSLKMMEDRGLKPDVYTYTVIISGYVRKLEMDEARKILDDAKKKCSKLSSATYHTLIRGYCKLEQFDEALGLLREMKEHGVQPSADEYNKLIQSLCLNALDWEKAEKLLEEMKGNGVHLNAITKGLIRAVKEMEQDELERKEMTVDA